MQFAKEYKTLRSKTLNGLMWLVLLLPSRKVVNLLLTLPKLSVSDYRLSVSRVQLQKTAKLVLATVTWLPCCFATKLNVSLSLPDTNRLLLPKVQLVLPNLQTKYARRSEE